MNLKKSIKVACAMRGITQEDLADLVGISGPALSRVGKRNACTTQTLKDICEELELPVSEFIKLGE